MCGRPGGGGPFSRLPALLYGSMMDGVGDQCCIKVHQSEYARQGRIDDVTSQDYDDSGCMSELGSYCLLLDLEVS